MGRIWALSDRGCVRRTNQDCFAFGYEGERLAWGVVCDGMGGANSGDVASRMASDSFKLDCKNLPSNADEAEDYLRQMAVEANRAVYDAACSDDSLKGMGTTMVGLISMDNELIVLNIGDSRAYYLTKNAISQITHDHSFVQELVRRGEITPEQARVHPRKNIITRAVGVTSSVQVDVFRRSTNAGDYVLLCSDGLVNKLTDEEILEEVNKGGTEEEICSRLIQGALKLGAEDNVTVLLLHL